MDLENFFRNLLNILGEITIDRCDFGEYNGYNDKYSKKITLGD